MALCSCESAPCWCLMWLCPCSAGAGADAGVDVDVGAGAGARGPRALSYPRGFAPTSPCSLDPRGKEWGTASGLSPPEQMDRKVPATSSKNACCGKNAF